MHAGPGPQSQGYYTRPIATPVKQISTRTIVGTGAWLEFEPRFYGLRNVNQVRKACL